MEHTSAADASDASQPGLMAGEEDVIIGCGLPVLL